MPTVEAAREYNVIVPVGITTRSVVSTVTMRKALTELFRRIERGGTAAIYGVHEHGAERQEQLLAQALGNGTVTLHIENPRAIGALQSILDPQPELATLSALDFDEPVQTFAGLELIEEGETPTPSRPIHWSIWECPETKIREVRFHHGATGRLLHHRMFAEDPTEARPWFLRRLEQCRRGEPFPGEEP